MKKIVSKIIAATLCVCLLLPALAACSEHVCTSVCQICGLCKNEDCKEPNCKEKCKCSSIKDKDASIRYFEVISEPKTNYIPGQKFDPSGLAVNVFLSNGKVKKYLDFDFEDYTHKDEPLTESVTKITFTLPGRDYTFDIPIIVRMAKTTAFIVDLAGIDSEYPVGTQIDLNRKAYCVDGEDVQTIENDVYAVSVNEKKVENIEEPYEFVAAGEYKIKYSYSVLSYEKTVKVYNNTDSDYVRYFDDSTNIFKNSVTLVKDENGKITQRVRGKETDVRFNYSTKYTELQNESSDGGIYVSNTSPACLGRTRCNYFENNQGGMEAYFKATVNLAKEGDYDIILRANVQRDMLKVKDLLEYSVNGKADADGLYTYTSCDTDDYIYNGAQLARYTAKYDAAKGYKSWYNLMNFTSARIATVHLNKGANTVRFRYKNGSGGHVDCFYIVPSSNKAEKDNAVFAVREGNFVDLAGENFIVLNRGEKVSTYTKTPSDHLVQYTNIFYRFANGFEVNIIEDMITGVDYDKTGLQTATVNTGDFYGLNATFTFKVLVVD